MSKESNQRMLDISSYKHLSHAQADTILLRYNDFVGQGKAASFFYCLAQYAQLRLEMEHGRGMDCDNEIVDDFLGDISSLLLPMAEGNKDA